MNEDKNIDPSDKIKRKHEGKLYIGAKLIIAEPMSECTFLKRFKNQDVTNYENQHGYKVIYPDGYISWSPKQTFETAYREVTDGEKRLF